MNTRLVAGAILLGAAGLAAWKFLPADEGNADAPTFTTANASRGKLVARVTATGSLSSLVTVQVGSQVSGRIQSLHADFNSQVKEGDVIARIDPQIFEANVEQARASLLAAEGNMTKAKALATDAQRQATRARELAEQRLISQAERDTAVANAESAQAGIASAQGSVALAQAALNQARINLAYTVIRSPTDGVVISRSVDVGQTVAASLQAPVLFTIAQDLRKMQVHTNVAEADVGKLQEGMDTSFTVDAYPSERFRGKVTQVRNAPQNVQNVVTYDAVIDVDNSDLRLKPGMTANVSFVYARREDALLVPNAALRYRPSAELLRDHASPDAAAGAGSEAGNPPRRRGEDASPNQRTVWTLDDGRLTARTVKVGVSDGSQTEILEGDLKEGQAVVTDASGKPRAPQLGRMF